MGTKSGVNEEDSRTHKKGQQGSESICYEERYHLLPSLSPGKTNVPKFMPIPRCEYSVNDRNITLPTAFGNILSILAF